MLHRKKKESKFLWFKISFFLESVLDLMREQGITGSYIIMESKSTKSCSRRGSVVESYSDSITVVTESLSKVLETNPDISIGLEEINTADPTLENSLPLNRQNLAYWCEAESLFASFKHKPFLSRQRSSYKFLCDEPKSNPSYDNRSFSYKYLQGIFPPPTKLNVAITADKTEKSGAALEKMSSAMDSEIQDKYSQRPKKLRENCDGGKPFHNCRKEINTSGQKQTLQSRLLAKTSTGEPSKLESISLQSGA